MNNSDTNTQNIQSEHDLRAAFKDNMFFGFCKTEGKKAQDRARMRHYDISGYYNGKKTGYGDAAYICGSRQFELNQIFAGSAASVSIGETIANKAVHLYETATAYVKNAYYEGVEMVYKGINHLTNAFNNAAEYTVQQLNTGMAYVGQQADYLMNKGAQMWNSGYASVQNGWNSTTGFFGELKDDALAFLQNSSIAGMMMLPQRTLSYASVPGSPALRI